MTDVAGSDRSAPLSIWASKLAALNDAIVLRDPAGRSARPRLRASRSSGLVVATGPFLIHHRYRVTREEGKRFVEVTGDPNPIHREGNIVAGAMTMSKVLAPLEVLMPAVDVLSLNIKFTSVCFYDDPLLSVFRLAPGRGGRWAADVLTYQSGRVAAKTTLSCRPRDTHEPRVKVGKWRVNRRILDDVCTFLRSLRIAPDGYLAKGEFRDYTYPLSFLASLPSGAIVEQMSGKGGLLNSLRLEFADTPKVPILAKTLPTVRLEQQKKRRSFNKILTDIVQGISTYCKGHAIVHPDAEVALDQLGQG